MSNPTHNFVTKQQNPGDGIPYDLFLDCVHCGLCTSACPTYVETGDENDGPRGRIHLMRAVTDGRLELDEKVTHHLERCLDCRACETSCPSGVQYGRLIEPFRVNMVEQAKGPSVDDDWFHHFILFGLFPYAQRMEWALLPARVAQSIGILQLVHRSGLTKWLPMRIRQLVEMLPRLEPACEPLPDYLPAKGKRRARVALFTGCVADAVFRHTHWATARVLQENGCEVIVPSNQTCCGAIHFHAGSSEPAREMADQNLAAFSVEEVDAIILNVAGCGAMLKDYGHHWDDSKQTEREKFTKKVKDVHEFLDELGFVPPDGPIPASATYHDACHLRHAQQVQGPPRKILQQIPGLKLIDLPESELCCGAAGTYNLTQPEMAEQLSVRKMKNITSTQAEIVLTANAGCLLQLQKGAQRDSYPAWIAHPMDLLDLSYRGLKPPTSASNV